MQNNDAWKIPTICVRFFSTLIEIYNRADGDINNIFIVVDILCTVHVLEKLLICFSILFGSPVCQGTAPVNTMHCTFSLSIFSHSIQCVYKKSQHRTTVECMLYLMLKRQRRIILSLINCVFSSTNRTRPASFHIAYIVGVFYWNFVLHCTLYTVATPNG